MDIHVPIQWTEQLIRHLNETWCIERFSEQSHQCQFMSYPCHLFDILRIELRNKNVDALYFRLRNAKGWINQFHALVKSALLRQASIFNYQTSQLYLIWPINQLYSFDNISSHNKHRSMNEPWTLLNQPYLTSNRIKRISHILQQNKYVVQQSIWFQVIKSSLLNLSCRNCGIVDEYCNASIDNSDVRYYELIIQLYVAYQSIWFIKQKSNQRAIPN